MDDFRINPGASNPIPRLEFGVGIKLQIFLLAFRRQHAENTPTGSVQVTEDGE